MGPPVADGTCGARVIRTRCSLTNRQILADPSRTINQGPTGSGVCVFLNRIRDVRRRRRATTDDEQHDPGAQHQQRHDPERLARPTPRSGGPGAARRHRAVEVVRDGRSLERALAGDQPGRAVERRPVGGDGDVPGAGVDRRARPPESPRRAPRPPGAGHAPTTMPHHPGPEQEHESDAHDRQQHDRQVVAGEPVGRPPRRRRHRGAEGTRQHATDPRRGGLAESLRPLVDCCPERPVEDGKRVPAEPQSVEDSEDGRPVVPPSHRGRDPRLLPRPAPELRHGRLRRGDHPRAPRQRGRAQLRGARRRPLDRRIGRVHHGADAPRWPHRRRRGHHHDRRRPDPPPPGHPHHDAAPAPRRRRGARRADRHPHRVGGIDLRALRVRGGHRSGAPAHPRRSRALRPTAGRRRNLAAGRPARRGGHRPVRRDLRRGPAHANRLAQRRPRELGPGPRRPRLRSSGPVDAPRGRAPRRRRLTRRLHHLAGRGTRRRRRPGRRERGPRRGPRRRDAGGRGGALEVPRRRRPGDRGRVGARTVRPVDTVAPGRVAPVAHVAAL